MDKIDLMKKEISNYIESLDSVDEEISVNEKVVLDDFFDKTSSFVIGSLLDRYKSILADQNRYKSTDNDFNPNKKFDISVPAIKFPNMNHEYSVLYYLEKKYNDKFIELGFENIGISNPHFIPSTTNFPNELFLNYTCSDSKKTFRDSSFGYRLEVGIDFRNVKSNNNVKIKK